MTSYNGSHYELISYKAKNILKFREIPFNIKTMVINKCLECNSGLYYLIDDFFGQINPSHYGGNNVTNKSSGLIYNKVLNYKPSENLFTLSQSIVKSLYEIWCEDDNFLMALNAILEHVRD